jgi:hypothetical protein
MAQIAALVTAAHEIDSRSRLLQFHFEGSHQGVFGHHGHAVARPGDVDANSEFVIGHVGVFLGAAIPMRTVTMVRLQFAAALARCSHKCDEPSTRHRCGIQN